MRWDTIYFDLDDTLLSYEQTFKYAASYTFLSLRSLWGIGDEVEVACWFRVFKKYCDEYWPFYEKKEWTKEQYRFKRFYDTMKEFHIEVNTEMASEFRRFFNKMVGKFATPINGIETLLMDLQKADIQLGIITNGKSEIQMEKIRTLGFQRFFSNNAIIISEDIQLEKPNPKIFASALARLKNYTFPPLYIGDSWLLDIVGAKSANWDTIYFNTRSVPPNTGISIVDVCHTTEELHKRIFFSL